MKKSIPLYLYGAIIIFEGISLIFSEYTGLNKLKFMLGIGLIIGAALAFLTAYLRPKKQVHFAYHEMHGFTMLVYAISVILFCNTVETLLYFTAFLFIFNAFAEIIFCTWLFNLGERVVFKIVFIRMFLGLATGVGTIAAMHYTGIDLKVAMAGYGTLFIIVGLNVILYVPVMKKEKLPSQNAQNN